MTTQTQNDSSNFWLLSGSLAACTYALFDNAPRISSLVSSTCGPIIQDASIFSTLACGGSRIVSVLYGASYVGMAGVTAWELTKLLGYEEAIKSRTKNLSSYLFTYAK